MRRILWITVWLLVITLLFNLNGGLNLFAKTTTIRAVGDLEVDWGVSEGNPIFVVNSIAPGDMETRTVELTNNASVVRPVGVRGVKNSETGDLSTVLHIVISEGGTDLYGGTHGVKTLSEFFEESGGPDGTFLLDMNPSDVKSIDFKVTFDEEASNDFQNKTLVFDLIIGISIEIPSECDGINFEGNPIFGTDGNDRIRGTNGNDLVFALEGNDVVNSSNGDDCVVGGAGNDIINNSNGNDIMLGEEGNDRLNGSNGRDIILGGDGRDIIKASNGNDVIEGGSGNDDIEGSNGDDNISGGEGNDNIDGGNGNDTVSGGPGNDNIRGRNGNDTLIGDDGSDSARGDLGTDTCDAEVEISCEL